MVNSTVKATGNFPERVRKRLHRLLKSESIEGYWAAGRILNKHFGERAAYGEMPKIEAELKSLGDAATSLSQLHQCRRLNATWKKKRRGGYARRAAVGPRHCVDFNLGRRNKAGAAGID